MPTSIPDPKAKPHVFPITYTRTLAREQGLDLHGQQRLLQGTDLQPEDLLRLNNSIDASTQSIIIRNALKLSGDPALGLRWGANLHVAAHGPLGTVIASSPSLGHAWRATEKFHAIRGGAISIRGEVAGEHFAVLLDIHLPMDEVGRFFVEATLATMVNHLGMIIGKANPALGIELAYAAPAYADQYAEYMNAPCSFGHASNRIIIPAGLSALPNPMADPDTYALALEQCEQIKLTQRSPAGWVSRVIELLRRNPGQIWTCEQVAEHFRLSSRTLMRYLRSEGTSYQTLRDTELERQARQSLENPKNTVESVAHSLGYQEASNFRRAFKRWTGLSPQAYVQAKRRR